MTIIPFAAGRSKGRAVLVVGTSTQTGSIGGPPVGRQQTAEPVEVRALDELLSDPGPVDLLKVDVEGWEGEVLRGADETLARTARVVMERHGMGGREAELVLESHGFARSFEYGAIAYYERRPS